MNRLLGATCLILSTLVAACGGDKGSSTPVAPSTPAAPTVNSITISGLDALRVGFFAEYSASATMSNGQVQAITPSWTSSNNSVGSVDATGRVDGNSQASSRSRLPIRGAVRQGASTS